VGHTVRRTPRGLEQRGKIGARPVRAGHIGVPGVASRATPGSLHPKTARTQRRVPEPEPDSPL